MEYLRHWISGRIGFWNVHADIQQRVLKTQAIGGVVIHPGACPAEGKVADAGSYTH